MLVKDILQTGKTAVSFEFFPPKTLQGWEKLFSNITQLSVLKPAYVSVTYGAGGGTRKHTHQLIEGLQKETNFEIVAHLTCVGHSRSEMARILDHYAAHAVRNILALRGDAPKEGPLPKGDFEHAVDLVDFIRTRHPEMGIGVAGFPEGHVEAGNRLTEIDRLKEKIDAGAHYIVTQLFFDNLDYYDFQERCRLAGITVPLIAGIMPITSQANLARMAELSPRTRFPAGLLRSLHRVKNDEQVEHVGSHWASEQIRDLLDHQIPGIHLYTLNNSAASLRIVESLGLDVFEGL